MPPVDVVQGVAGGVVVVIVVDPEEGEEAAGFDATGRVPFDVLLGGPRHLVTEIGHIHFSSGAPKILCHRHLLLGRVAI